MPHIAYFGPWPETLARWRREGLGDGEWWQAAGFEDGAQHPVPINAYLCPLYEEVTLARDGATTTVRDKHGIVKRVSAGSESMPQFLDHPLHDRDDWRRLAPRLANPADPARYPDDWQPWLREWSGKDAILFLGMLPNGFFGALRELMGLERALTAFYDDPPLVEEVLDTACDLWSSLYTAVLRQIDVCFVFIWEDMCYRGGPLIAPATFRRYLLPRYRRLCQSLRAADVENVAVDSDGDVTQLVPLWLEGGVSGVQPFEVASGLDRLALARRFPEMQMMGGVDKRALAAGPSAIDAELAGLMPLLERGRYVPTVDHLVPPDVSWANYCYFAERLGRLLGR